MPGPRDQEEVPVAREGEDLIGCIDVGGTMRNLSYNFNLFDIELVCANFKQALFILF